MKNFEQETKHNDCKLYLDEFVFKLLTDVDMLLSNKYMKD